ncbi:Carboxylesterase type B [Penicillium atrosanguineum]|nr:Carboxylesterase type B [Penicillium atrosanguineum]
MKRLLITLLPALVAAAFPSPSVTIDAGTIEGGRCDGKNAVFYKAIPFAEPPIHELRFEPPKAYKKQFPDGKLNATTSALTCIQFSDAFTPTKLNSTALSSEDCLYLDIWAPSNATKDSKLPVKVWIYGGSQTEGSISDPLYDGCNTADGGSILVSVNYRLGPLGFMALESAGIYGNQGVQDLLLGLQWVQDNIAAFGGDPDKVLLFGQSAGAENAYIIASLPQAPSLINSVISESGGGRSLTTNATQQKVGASYANALQCSSSNKTCLQSRTVSDLFIANAADTFLYEGIGYYGNEGSLSVLSEGTHNFYPYVDGKVIDEDPYNRGVQVPAVFGSNYDEGIIYSLLWAITGKTTPTISIYKDFLRKNFGAAASLVGKYYQPSFFESAASALLASGQAAAIGGNKTTIEIFLAMTKVITDSTYRCPAWYGAAQATRNNISAWTAQMMDAWTAMAENADPSTEDISWPQFQSSKDLSTPGMIFGNSSVSDSISYKYCDMWIQVNEILSASNATATGTSSKGNGNATSSSASTMANGAATMLSTSGGLLALSMLLLVVAGNS